jgi:hypothetical protein
MVPAVNEVLAATADAFISAGFGFEPPGLGPAAAGAGEAIGPAQRCEVLGASHLIAQALLGITH